LLPEGKLPILKSVRYTDIALREFFRSAENEPWFSNTLFVITSDHTSLADDPFYKTRAGIYSIPLLFFDPAGINGSGTEQTAQQIDVVPSVLHLLGYPEAFFSFGSDLFNPDAPRFAVNFLQGTYQLIEADHSLVLDTLHPPSLFDLKEDPLQLIDRSAEDTVRARNMEYRMRAFIQQYNTALLENKMHVNSTESDKR
jgi:membrane-anchored protein YejM (alkaline phosphatase superfamily)